MIGIVGYGSYVPCYRITVDEIAKQWGKNGDEIKNGILVYEKSVPGMDEDAITIAVAAAKNAINRAQIDPKNIGAVYIGSESHPYAVKPSGTVLVDALGIGPDVHVADFEFACKAGSEAMYVAYSHIKSGEMDYAMGIGADTSQGAPNDALEFTASAGGSAFIMGKEKVLAEILATYSYASDTADFWRREGRMYPMHGSRFTGDPAYFKHVLGAAEGILNQTGMKPSDFKYAVFHMPNGKFPLKAGKTLGFSKEQMEPGWVVPWIGNTYSGSSITGLSATLDVAAPGDKILMVSFGSGAGSDAFVFQMTEEIENARHRAPTFKEITTTKRIYLTYGEYVRYRGKIQLND